MLNGANGICDVIRFEAANSRDHECRNPVKKQSTISGLSLYGMPNAAVHLMASSLCAYTEQALSGPIVLIRKLSYIRTSAPHSSFDTLDSLSMTLLPLPRQLDLGFPPGRGHLFANEGSPKEDQRSDFSFDDKGRATHSVSVRTNGLTSIVSPCSVCTLPNHFFLNSSGSGTVPGGAKALAVLKKKNGLPASGAKRSALPAEETAGAGMKTGATGSG